VLPRAAASARRRAPPTTCAAPAAFAYAVICIVFYREGFGQELMLAFVITTATFLCLTVFTIFSRIDFSFLGPVLFLGIFILLIW
jgi:FtsH-binding integral membrane protein